MYVEDVDYCKHVRLRGYAVAYVPEVHVVHYEGAGKAWIGQGALTRTVRSYRLYITKHHGHAVATITGAALALVLALRVPAYALRHLLQGRQIDREKAVGYAAAARQALTPLQG